MAQEQDQVCDRRLLVFNCHEAWVYQLGWLGYKLDIVIGLSSFCDKVALHLAVQDLYKTHCYIFYCLSNFLKFV